MRRAVVVLWALAVVLGSCARGDDPAKPIRTLEPQYTASSPSPRATARDSTACRLLTSKERASIAGENIDAVTPIVTQGEGRRCRWVKTLSKPLPALEVVTSPAQVWVVQLPSLIDSAIVSGRAERFTERLQAAKKKVLQGADKLSDTEACEMFSLLARANGGQKGATGSAGFFTAESGQFAAAAERCTQGVHTLLVYEENGLSPSRPLSDAMVRLVKIAQKRAIEVR